MTRRMRPTVIAPARRGTMAQPGVGHPLHPSGGSQGFKAGALENGLKTAKGEFIAIFDADFVPEPDFLQKAIHHFTDPRVGMVQGRWEHLNREYSFLTRTQAIFLDGHFMLESFTRFLERTLFQLQRDRRNPAARRRSKTPAGGSTTP